MRTYFFFTYGNYKTIKRYFVKRDVVNCRAIKQKPLSVSYEELPDQIIKKKMFILSLEI